MNSSYLSRFKSTGLIAVVQVFKVLCNVFQSKVLAILVGPNGFGLWGILNSYNAFLSNALIFGLDQSVVKEVSQSKNKDYSLVYYFVALKFIVFVFLIIAFVQIVLFNIFNIDIIPASLSRFDFVLLNISVLLTSLSLLNYSYLNGLRLIKKIVFAQVLSIIIGSIISIISVYLYGESGIVLFIVFYNFTSFIVSLLFLINRIFKIRNIDKIRHIIVFNRLLKIAVTVTISSSFVSLITYLIQLLLEKECGLYFLGIYNASFTVANVYIGVILYAMGIDFYPKLAELKNDADELNKIVNSQISFGLTIAIFGVLLVSTFSEYIFKILYSHEFLKSIDILLLQITGVFLRVFSFPLLYTLLVLEKRLIYIVSHIVLWSSNYLLLFVFVEFWKEDYVGLNYSLSYVIFIAYLLYVIKGTIALDRSVIVKGLVFLSVLLLSLCLQNLKPFLDSFLILVIRCILIVVLFLIILIKSKYEIFSKTTQVS